MSEVVDRPEDSPHYPQTVWELGHDRRVCAECGTTWPCVESVKERCWRLNLREGLACECGWHEEKVAQDLEQEKVGSTGWSLAHLSHGELVTELERARAEIAALKAELADERADRKAFHEHYVKAEADATALRDEHR